MNRWLVKSDPDTYSWADLVREKRTVWDGVGNNTALMHLRAMKKGDEVMVYESGKPKVIVGLATIVKGPYPDPNRDDPRFVVVDLKAGKPLAKPVTLADLKADGGFTEFPLVRISRLSVMPVTASPTLVAKVWENDGSVPIGGATTNERDGSPFANSSGRRRRA